LNEFRSTKQHEIWQTVAIYFKATAKTTDVTLSLDHCEYQWIDAKSYKEYTLVDDLCRVFESYISQP
jgi:hypothetical protein